MPPGKKASCKIYEIKELIFLVRIREKFTEDMKWPINILKDINLIYKVIKWIHISTKLAEIKASNSTQGRQEYVCIWFLFYTVSYWGQNWISGFFFFFRVIWYYKPKLLKMQIHFVPKISLIGIFHLKIVRDT